MNTMTYLTYHPTLDSVWSVIPLYTVLMKGPGGNALSVWGDVPDSYSGKDFNSDFNSNYA